MSAKVLFHIDLNAFYASVHQNEQPQLMGKPVVVTRNVRGAIITTASYEARAFGVHSAMPLAHALNKCPELIVVEPDFGKYREVSKQFIDVVKTFSPIVEVLSIDECFVDVSEVIKKYEKPLDLAYSIQNTLKQKLNLTCSIGVAPNRFLAKMASDFMKPNGISILRKREVKQKLWPLPIESFYGIGKVTQSKLKEINVLTIGDLVTADRDKLENILHNQIDSILEKANGIDSAEVNEEIEVKSISASNSLYQGIEDYEECITVLYEQSDDVSRKLKQHNMIGLTLSVAVGFNQKNPTSKSFRDESGFDDLPQIYQRALLLFDEFELSEPITFLSVSLSNLKENTEDEIYTLFNYQNQQNTVSDIILKVNELFDKSVLKKASDSYDE